MQTLLDSKPDGSLAVIPIARSEQDVWQTPARGWANAYATLLP